MGLRSCVVVGAAVVCGGCGGGEERANEPRPPSAINVTAAVADGRIAVSPRAFGAGPILLIISNQTPRAQAVTFETAATDDDGPGLVQTTSPINPAGTAAIEVDVPEGRYRLSTADRAIRPAAVRVGAQRASAQGDLLTP
jgi:hypothetical protein